MKLLVGYDGSECSKATLANLKQAGLPTSGQALIVSVAEAAEEFDRAGHAVKFAAELCTQILPNWQVSTDAWVGVAKSSLLKRAESWKPDIMVMGSHGRSVVGRLILGSVSQYILHYAPCSVRIGRPSPHST